jgi:hypothetical protein
MTRMESKDIYFDIDLWDTYSVGGKWKTLRENKLEEFKRQIKDTPPP